MDTAKAKRSIGRSWRIDGLRETRRRRQWTASEKAQILAESFFPGVNISAVARRHGVGANVLFRWRREALDASLSASPAFMSVTTAAPAASPCEAGATPEDEAAEDTSGARSGLIEIELAGARIRVRGAVNEAQLRTALAAVRGLA